MASPLHSPADLSVSHIFRAMLLLSLGTALANGLSRFSYALLLPAMKSELGWNYTAAGGLNTANAMGYLVGAFVSARCIRRWGAQKSMLAGGVITALALMALAGSSDYTLLLLWRLIAGVSGALVFVAGGVQASGYAHLQPQRSGLLLGLFYGGVGLGMMFSAAAVPLILSFLGAPGWRAAWLALGLMSLVCGGLASSVPPAHGPTTGNGHGHHAMLRQFAPALLSYFLFGVGYIGYMTFIVALIKDRGATAGDIAGFWFALGAACFASSWIWAKVMDRGQGGRPLALLTSLCGLAGLVPVLWPGFVAALASALMFGATFLAVVTATTSLARRELPREAWPAGIAAFTTAFATGQILGPVITGHVADAVGGLEQGLGLSAFVLVLGGLIALRQR